jgi:arylsulfatase A-like enzyme
MSARTNPNVLLITTDEQRFDALGCNGNDHVITPNLDRLAAGGVNFTAHTTSCPLCTPARASILTGQYARTHGAWTVGVTLDSNARGLSHWLADAGWRTGFFGKAHFEAELSEYMVGMDHSRPYYGFQDFAITEDHNIGEYMDWIKAHHPEHYSAARNNTHEDRRDTPLPDRGPGTLTACYLSTLPENLHQTAWIADRTIDFIGHNKGQGAPFFAWCSFVDPHHPFNPPAEFAAMYDVSKMPGPMMKPGENAHLPTGYYHVEGMGLEEYQRMKAYYYAMITHIDSHIGRILGVLEAQGELDNTIVIFTSDHGDYLGDHGLIRKCVDIYDCLLRIPLIIRAPGATGRATCSDMTQHEDLAPTIMDLLGLPVPEGVQGMSFASALKGNGAGPRQTACHYYPTGKTDGLQAVRDRRWKLVYDPRADSWALRNLKDDPMEYENRISDPSCASIVDRLKSDLVRSLVRFPSYRPPRTHGW